MGEKVDELVAKILSNRFSYYLERSGFKRSTFPGNNAILKRIEKNDKLIEYKYQNGKMVASSIITEGFIHSCQEYFHCSKIDLMFGGEAKLEELLYGLFFYISKLAFIHDLDSEFLRNYPGYFLEDKRYIKLQREMYQLFSFSAEYCVKRYNFINSFYTIMPFYEYDGEEIIFFDHNFTQITTYLEGVEKTFSMSIPFYDILRFFWAAIKDEFIDSFKDKIIKYLVTVPNDSDKKPIKFYELKDRVNDWLIEDVSQKIIPNVVSIFEKNDIFSLGIQAKILVDSRTKNVRDLSEVKDDSSIRISIIKKVKNWNEEFVDSHIKEEEIVCGDLLSEVYKIRNAGYHVRINYRRENNRKAIQFLRNQIIEEREILIEELVFTQQFIFATVACGEEKTFLEI